MEIKEANIATAGFAQHEQTGTIAIDFANYLDSLSDLGSIDLKALMKQGWYQVGFRFDLSLLKSNETINLHIVLCKKKSVDDIEFGFVPRTILRSDFLSLVVSFTAHISNRNHFRNDDINWQDLSQICE